MVGFRFGGSEGQTASAFEIEPPKAALTDLESGEQMRFQFNPPEFSENFQVNYARHNVPGLSHQVLHYINTNNETIPIQIYLSELLRAEGDPRNIPGANIPRAPVNVDMGRLSAHLAARKFSVLDSKNFLQALVHPIRAAAGGRQAPPRVLFVWPGVIRMTAIVSSLQFQHRRFSVETLETTVLMATLTLEEASGIQRYSSDVRRHGTGVGYGNAPRIPNPIA